MTSKDIVLADSISYLPHLQAFDLLAKMRLENVGLEKMLVYIIDTVDVSALPFLAAQFDVLGFNGYQLATTDLQRRVVIKNGIELHRYKGTIWAIKTALANIGYSNITLTEHVVGSWAKFSISLSTGAVLTSTTAADIVKMVNAFKNTRSHLDSIQVEIAVDDTLTSVIDEGFVNESFDATDYLFLTGNLKYNGVGKYDGTYQHNGDSDTTNTTP